MTHANDSGLSVKPAHDLGPIILRAYAVPVKAPPALGARKRSSPALDEPSEWSLVFDTETTTDAAQCLRIGSYQIWKGRDLIEQGLFYDPEAVSTSERLTLKRYTHARGLMRLTLSDFIEKNFFGVGYDLDASIVGFNLPFDISRLAHRHGSARGKIMRGGFSFTLSRSRYRPQVQVKHLSRRAAFIQFAGTSEQRLTQRRQKHLEYQPPQRGFFVDVKTISAALTSRSDSLSSLSEFLEVPHKKLETKRHGQRLTAQYLDYAMRDVQTTWECYTELTEHYAKLGLSTPIHRIYSEASIGKAYLKQMQVKPWHELQPEFPPHLIGIIMSTYYGGRSEVHLRRVVRQVLYCDFLSMYPTVCTLMGLWRWIIAEGVTWQDTTQETTDFLNRVQAADLLSPESWKQQLTTLVRVVPDGDLFPVRAQYGGEDQSTIGLNFLQSDEPVWYTVADCIASKLLTGKTPRVLEALSFAPLEIQKGLKPVTIAGNAEYKVDPTKDDFFSRVIDLRAAVKRCLKVATGAEATALDSEQLALKLVANSTSYGIFVELNVEDSDIAVDLRCYGADGLDFSLTRKKIEKPGPFFHPLLGTLITGAARLMLTLTEKRILDVGLDYAFCDTDSMAIAKPDGMDDAEFYRRADTVIDGFTALNPYAVKGHLLKVEDANFSLCDGKPTSQREPLSCFNISSKRYALFNRDAEGRPVLRKASAHGLGHLRPPYEDDDGPSDIPGPATSLADIGVRRWHYDFWYRIVQAAYSEHPEQVDTDLPGWNQPAASRYAATSPQLLGWFKTYNEGKPYREQVRPFNFLMTYQPQTLVSRMQARVAGRRQKKRRLPKSVAPFDRHLKSAVKRCFDRDTGKSIRASDLKTYREVLSRYHLHPEAKFLNGGYTDSGPTERRHIRASARHYIGKEANQLEKQVYLGYDPEAQIEYGAAPEDRAQRLKGISEAAEKYGLEELAQAAGLSRQQLFAVMNGRSQATPRTMAKLTAGINMLAEACVNEGRLFRWAQMESARLGQRQFARTLGMDQGNLSRMLLGKRRPTRRVLERLSQMFADGGHRQMKSAGRGDVKNVKCSGYSYTPRIRHPL